VSYSNKHRPKRKWSDNPKNFCRCGNRKRDGRNKTCNLCREKIRSSLPTERDILGMPVGTAFNRLRKSILFDCIRKLSLDKCYRCSSEIEHIDDLSVEHKIPWHSSNSAELFWNLDNVTFSHFKCNIRARAPVRSI
jgi:5-methylcytosine-specific restriction endonuclease McrA